MTDYTQHIQEETVEPSFFAMIPHMAMLDLDPFELTLYCHYKKVVGESPDGKCFKSNKALAAETKMSVSQMRRARKGLEDRRYISVIHNPDPNGNINAPPIILIKNIWAINRQVSLVEYGGAVLPEQGGVYQNRGAVLPDTHNKRNLNKKKKKDSASQKIDAGGDVESNDSKSSSEVPNAGTVPSATKPKKVESTPAPRRTRKANPVFDPIFDELQTQFWDTVAECSAFAPDDDRENGGRIAKIAHWHCGKAYKGVRVIGKPATIDTVAQHVRAIKKFRKWLNDEHEGISIHDLTKYVEWYGKWHTALMKVEKPIKNNVRMKDPYAEGASL